MTGKHLFRFFGEHGGGKSWVIVGEELHHLTKVLRIREGAAIEVTDGAGRWAKGIVTSLTKMSATVDADQPTVEPSKAPSLTIAIPQIKGSTFDDLLAPVTELGCDRILLFRQPGQPKLRANDKTLGRWQKLLRTACKQAKRSYLPTIDLIDDYKVVLAALAKCDAKFVLDPDSEVSLADALSKLGPARSMTEVACLLGSEEGIVIPSAELSSAGWSPVRLSAHILRAYTATIAACALIGTWRG